MNDFFLLNVFFKSSLSEPKFLHWVFHCSVSDSLFGVFNERYSFRLFSEWFITQFVYWVFLHSMRDSSFRLFTKWFLVHLVIFRSLCFINCSVCSLSDSFVHCVMFFFLFTDCSFVRDAPSQCFSSRTESGGATKWRWWDLTGPAVTYPLRTPGPVNMSNTQAP